MPRVDRLSKVVRPLPSTAVALVVTVAFAAFFRLHWHADAKFLLYNVPIAVPFVLFFADRVAVRSTGPALLVDGVVVALALCRVAIPPFPFVSGHSLFVAYAAATARTVPLAVSAAVVLVQVLVTKAVLWGDWRSGPAGAVAAIAAAWLRRAWTRRGT